MERYIILCTNTDPDGGHEEVAAVKLNEKSAREKVRDLRQGELGESRRATAISLTTGRTLAGPGRLGPENGKTARRKARAAEKNAVSNPAG